MLAKVWQLMLLGLGLAQNQDSFLSPLSLENMKTCPFPMADTIAPCSCKVNEKFQVFLTCYIEQDMDEKLLKRLNRAFACKKDIHVFDVNLNGFKWIPDFSAEMIGQFKISYYHLSNFNSIDGDIQAGAFNGSSFSLKEFNIGTSNEECTLREVKTGAFSKIQTLKKVSLGGCFGTLKTKAFFDLPKFEQLVVNAKAISTIESQAFDELPSLKILDLSSQSISSLSLRTFSNLANLTELMLNENMIEKIEDSTFYNMPKLVNLDLSNNSDLTHLGNIFENFQNADLVVNLADTNVQVLLKDSFKSFIETVGENNGKGYIDMTNVPLQCTCDVKWLFKSNLQWRELLKNSTCQSGLSIQEVCKFAFSGFPFLFFKFQMKDMKDIFDISYTIRMIFIWKCLKLTYE